MTPLVLIPILILALVALVLVINGLRFEATVRGEVEELLRASVTVGTGRVTEEDIETLPEPVRRYLGYTGTVGREHARTMRIEQRGSIRLRPNGRWFPFLAEQYYSTDPLAFVWSAKIGLGPFTLLRAMDRYKGGRGHMVGKLVSTFRVVEGTGREMDEASLTRYLNEMLWFPSVYLSDRIRWEGIDDRTAKATIRDGDLEVSGQLRFDEDGRMVDFVSPRYRSVGDGFELDRWSTPIGDYRTFDGRRLPAVGSARWMLESGDFTYIRIELTRVEVNRVR
jgi:hypothetical protein